MEGIRDGSEKDQQLYRWISYFKLKAKGYNFEEEEQEEDSNECDDIYAVETPDNNLKYCSSTEGFSEHEIEVERVKSNLIDKFNEDS